MSSQPPDPNMFTSPFQLTQAMHRDVYSLVDPSDPTVREAGGGKVVLITGAAGGLGWKIAEAWSAANAAGIVLIGRNAETLKEVAGSLDVPTLVASGDIASSEDVKVMYESAIARFGKVDVLINTAGGPVSSGPIGETEPASWWKGLELNLLGFYNMAHYFIRNTNGYGTVINLVSLSAFIVRAGSSDYSCSKLAVIKLAEYLSLENPDLRVFSVHPGIVQPKGRGPEMGPFAYFAKDSQDLTAGVTLYLQKAEADHLRGGYISVNWDVGEMEAHREEIVKKELLKLGSVRAKLGPEGHPWES